MASSDGGTFLAQAAQPAPANGPRRISFVAGTRRVFTVAPGETVVLDAQPSDVTYRRSGNSVLVTHANGAEVLLSGATPDGEPALVTIGNLTLPLLDIIATGLQAVAPAAGAALGGLNAAGPIGLAGGNGQFRELEIDPLAGLSDTGPLGFSQLQRIVPDPLFTPGALRVLCPERRQRGRDGRPGRHGAGQQPYPHRRHREPVARHRPGAGAGRPVAATTRVRPSRRCARRCASTPPR